MTTEPKKTLMNEVLPAPTAASTSSPRARAQERLQALAKKAALAGAAGTLSACVGYGVVDPLPTPVQCEADDPLTSWATASVSGQLPTLTLSLVLLEGAVEGVHLANQFDVEGAVLVGAPAFNGSDLASSTTVTLALQVDDGADEVIVHTGLTCLGDGRAVDVRIDTVTFVASLM